MKTADEILNMVNEFLENLPYDRKPSMCSLWGASASVQP